MFSVLRSFLFFFLDVFALLVVVTVAQKNEIEKQNGEKQKPI